MPVLMQWVRDELEDKSDISNLGKRPDGRYKKVPPALVGRKIKDYSISRVTKVTLHPDPKKGILKFKGTVVSVDTGNKYKAIVQFHDVEFREASSAQFKHKVEHKGKAYYFRTLQYNKNMLSFRCHCPDWRHRFEHPMSQADALVGPKRQYTRKTPKYKWDRKTKQNIGGRPEVNVTKKLGICKHLHSFMAQLKDKGYAKEGKKR